MSMKETAKGALVASAVAALFAAGAHAQDKGAKKEAGTKEAVRCAGINSCKGQGKCSGGGNSCAGTNSCKGKGWVAVKDDKACQAKGGTVVAK